MSQSANPGVLEHYAALCRERGCVLPVDAGTYRKFIELPDDAMEGLLCLLIVNNAGTIERWVEDDALKKCPQDVEDMLETQLYMVARGFMRFSDEGQSRCWQPEGPEPSDEEEGDINARILSSRTLMGLAMRRVNRLFRAGAD